MREEGYVEEVSVVASGAYVLSGAASGSTVLYVEDASDFNDNGGQLLIGEEVYDYDTADMVANTITLTSGLLSAVEEETAISVYPISEEKQARVSVSDDSESITAVVTHALFSRLKEGIRVPGTREAVAMELVGSTWFIVDVIGQEPSPITEDELDPEIPASINDAKQAAIDALAEAESAMQFAVSKNKTFRQDEEPTEGMDPGDIWFDTNDGDRMYSYDPIEGWVEVGAAVSQEIQDAITQAQQSANEAIGQAEDAFNQANSALGAANTAQDTADNAQSAAAGAVSTANAAVIAANGKNKIIYSLSPPGE